MKLPILYDAELVCKANKEKRETVREILQMDEYDPAADKKDLWEPRMPVQFWVGFAAYRPAVWIRSEGADRCRIRLQLPRLRAATELALAVIWLAALPFLVRIASDGRSIVPLSIAVALFALILLAQGIAWVYGNRELMTMLALYGWEEEKKIQEKG